ncbi:hypothetical protein ACI782_07935 [Geodermatophilus sp. SYSU D00703]
MFATLLSRDALDADPNTLIFERRRGTVRVHGLRVPSLFNRYGVERRRWDHLEKCWTAPIGYVPALLERAEKDRRNVMIEQVYE